MMEAGTRLRRAGELLDRMKSVAFAGLTAGAITAKFPEYLPPFILCKAGEEGVCRAVACLASCALPHDTFFVSAYYEDRRDPAECCVVLSLELRRSGAENGFAVENFFAQESATVTQELLSSDVALSMAAGNGQLTFDFRFPVHRQGYKRRNHRDAILLVEDDGCVRGATREVLEAAGYRVLETASAEEALEVFERQENTICAVLSDVTLPGKSGGELARALHVRLATVPIVLTSGYQTPIKEDLLRRMFYLAKPYHSAALLAVIRRSLEVYHRPVAQRVVEPRFTAEVYR